VGAIVGSPTCRRCKRLGACRLDLIDTTTKKRQTTQQTFGLKRFVVTHAAAATLSFGILLSAALGVTALTATGNLPWAHDNVAAVAAQQPLATAQRNARMAALIEAKQALLEANELRASRSATQSTAHEKQLQFFALKEERLLALSRPVAETIHERDRADAINALRATPRMDAAPGWTPTPDGCSCPLADSWTLPGDLTPVRVWR
jgi:hypothetical protein